MARRSIEERRRDRAAGIGLDGRPLPRAAGVSPKQLRRIHPELTLAELRALSARLARRARLEEIARL